MQQQTKGNLYLIPTSIADGTSTEMLTPQLTSVIKELNYFLVENVRTARRFISSLKLNITIEDLKFEVLDKNTTEPQTNELCAPALTGTDIGIMSEAGCPGIADPGNMAVKFAHQHKVRVIPMVGPSSIFMALMASGFNGQSFAFHGYLPIDKKQRIAKIRELEKLAFKIGQTQIFMETPYRNDKLLLDILNTCGKSTNLCIARNVTGENELIRTLSIGEWKRSKPKLHKAPTVFLLSS